MTVRQDTLGTSALTMHWFPWRMAPVPLMFRPQVQDRDLKGEVFNQINHVALSHQSLQCPSTHRKEGIQRK